MTDYNRGLFRFIENSPTPFHAVANIAERLVKAGFTQLYEEEPWRLQSGKYFVCRNLSSLIAFVLPEQFEGFQIIASHVDSPAFKLKANPDLYTGLYARLNTEKYGGMIYSSWFDRPLSIAGRIVKECPGGIKIELVNIDRDVCMIPNIAIHLQPEQNEGKKINLQKDTLPLFGTGKKKLADLIDLQGALAADLYLYNRDYGRMLGADAEFIGAPRLDDLQCAYATLEGFIAAAPGRSTAIYSAFDNEEVGSLTKQGADSTFLRDILDRICTSMGLAPEQSARLYANSFLLSADNAHAIHPNHPELHDENNFPVMNGGIVIKHNAAMNYTTDAVSAAVVKKICQSAGVPCQSFTFRSDLRSSHTLGPIAGSHVSVCSADIGLAQLAMHSAFETAGAKDTAYLAQAAKAFYQAALRTEKDHIIHIMER